MRRPGLSAAAAARVGKSEASKERGEATSGGASKRCAVDCLMVTGREAALLSTSLGMAGGGRSDAWGCGGTGGGGWAAPAAWPPCAAVLASSHALSTASASSRMWNASAAANARRDTCVSWAGTSVCAQTATWSQKQAPSRRKLPVAHLCCCVQPGKHRVRLQTALESLLQDSLCAAAVCVLCWRIRHG